MNIPNESDEKSPLNNSDLVVMMDIDEESSSVTLSLSRAVGGGQHNNCRIDRTQKPLKMKETSRNLIVVQVGIAPMIQMKRCHHLTRTHNYRTMRILKGSDENSKQQSQI